MSKYSKYSGVGLIYVASELLTTEIITRLRYVEDTVLIEEHSGMKNREKGVKELTKL